MAAVERAYVDDRNARVPFRRRALHLAAAVTIAAATLGVLQQGVRAAGTTNGDSISWLQTQCFATIFGNTIAQDIDLASQAVVPNQVNPSDAYSGTIPGGTATLPSTASGFTISGYKNIRNVYLFRSSAGSVGITNVTAPATADNNGNPVAFNVSSTTEGTSVALSAASWTNASGGTLTYTSTVAHGLGDLQAVDVTGATNPGYNQSGALISVPSSTTFTVKGHAVPIQTASWSAADGGTITYTTTIKHHFTVGQWITPLGSSPGGYNKSGAKVPVAAVLSDTQFTIIGTGADPGPMTTAGTIDSLGNPGAIGTNKGTVRTLATVTSSIPAASPGTVTAPDVTISFAAPAVAATVTSYAPGVTTTATLVGPGDALTFCPLPHTDPQTDGISATLVGAGGPTTSSYPTCRPPAVCATTSTTAPTTTTTTATTTTTTALVAPTVSNLSPNSGPAAGGTSVTITGSDFTGATAVDFGPNAAASFSVDSDSSISATSPAGSGTVDVRVAGPGGTSATNVSDQFGYIAAPTVTSVTPNTGPTAGGTSVVIGGTGLTGATAVAFDGTPATFVVNDDTSISATSPAHGAGPADVTVTGPGGTSAASANDQFTYTAPPACAPCVSVGDAANLERDSGSKGLTFPVTLSQPATGTVTVAYAVTSGSATGGTKLIAGTDFKLKSGTITFKVGKSGTTAISKTISVSVIGDTAVEPDETFAVTLSNPTGGYSLGDGTATGTIIDDDGGPPGITVGIGDRSLMVADSGSQSLKFAVTLSSASTSPISVAYTVTPGSAAYSAKATGGGDFGGKLTGTLNFTVGASGMTATSKTISIPIWPDAALAGSRSFTITLSNLTGSGVTLIRATGTGTILAQP